MNKLLSSNIEKRIEEIEFFIFKKKKDDQGNPTVFDEIDARFVTTIDTFNKTIHELDQQTNSTSGEMEITKILVNKL